MLPALLLMPRPDDHVLDMCAAPGSKSLQLIEMARGGSGMVWCNDASLGRAISLNHRLQGANTAQAPPKHGSGPPPRNPKVCLSLL